MDKNTLYVPEELIRLYEQAVPNGNLGSLLQSAMQQAIDQERGRGTQHERQQTMMLDFIVRIGQQLDTIQRQLGEARAAQAEEPLERAYLNHLGKPNMAPLTHTELQEDLDKLREALKSQDSEVEERLDAIIDVQRARISELAELAKELTLRVTSAEDQHARHLGGNYEEHGQNEVWTHAKTVAEVTALEKRVQALENARTKKPPG